MSIWPLTASVNKLKHDQIRSIDFLAIARRTLVHYLPRTIYSHLHPLDLDSPRVCGLVQARLHDVRDGLPLREDLGQVLGAQNVPQCRRREEPRRMAEGRRQKGQK